MPFLDRSALPEHIDEQHEIDAAFPDDSQYGGFFGNALKWVKKKTKHWSAFSCRSPVGVAIMVAPWFLLAWCLGWCVWQWPWTWWALWPFYPVLRKWRKKPFVIFAVCGKGNWRLEKLTGGDASAPKQIMFMKNLEGIYYLSRVQPWTRWHFIVFWPLSIQFCFFPKPEDVVPVMEHRDTDGKQWFTYLIGHYDGDWIHWVPSGYFGKNMK